jgi:two-component system, OmpR family, alkaline phosphatase synthesis response regulator PhoP
MQETKKTVLVVDDESDIVDMIGYNLRKEGFGVLTAFNGTDALEEAKKIPDLIILDVMLPGLDGWEVMRRLRADRATAQIPIIFLTARTAEMDEILGLELGANDYLVKPVGMPKLTARIRHVFRKKEGKAEDDQPVVAGALEIHPSKHQIRIGEKEIHFTRKEFNILLYFARRIDHVVKRDVLLSEVWGTDVRVVSRSVDVHIRKIREKLGEYGKYIETITGVGYRMRVDNR